MKKQLKLAIFAFGMLVAGVANAQQTSGDITGGRIEDTHKSSNLNGTIRVIDNKGTKKYLQVKNGLTLLTDITPNGGIVSTWQLGGTLSENTYIVASGETSAGAGDAKEFALDGLQLVGSPLTQAQYDALPTAEQTPENQARIISTDATDRSNHGTGNGITVLIRNEATGAVQKMLISDLLQVQSGHDVFNATVADPAVGPTTAELTFDMTVALPTYENVSVYRNGAKLVANVDYSISGTTVVLDTSASAPNDWTLYSGDVIEVHYVK